MARKPIAAADVTLALVFAIAIGVAASQAPPPRDVVVPATGMGAIDGAVTADDTNAPARGARVALASGALRSDQTQITDETGRFTFTSLPVGAFTLTVSKPPYLTVIYGQKAPGQPGTPIRLAAGQHVSGLTLHLPRGGVIAGTVYDEQGHPASTIQMQALRAVITSGVRGFEQAGSVATDDRGAYRIFGLLPGHYVVAARTLAGRGPSAPSTTAENSTSAYAPAYYPGATMFTEATTIPLGLSDERDGIDVHLTRVPMARIEGHVSTPDGNVQDVIVTMAKDQDSNVDVTAGWPQARVSPDGRFSLTGVPPGGYVLRARRLGRGGGAPPPSAPAGSGDVPRVVVPPLWGRTGVVVSGQNLADVAINLEPGVLVTGRLTFDGARPIAPSSGGPAPFQVSLAPIGSVNFVTAPQIARIDDAGAFGINGVPPGRYLLRMAGLPAGFMVKSAIAAGRELLDAPIEISPDSPIEGILLTVSDRITELGGTLRDGTGSPAPGYTMVVFPDDPQMWTTESRRIQGTRPATDGAYSFSGLPAGRYRIAAVTDVEPGEWFVPSFLASIMAASQPLTLADGEHKTEDLQIGTK